MTSLFALALLAQVTYDVPLAPSAYPVRGTQPRVAYNGAEYVIIWVDERLDALRARRIDDVRREDVWWARAAAGAGPQAHAPVSPGRLINQLTLTANPQANMVEAFWVESGPAGRPLIQHAALAEDGGVVRFTPIDDPAGSISGLTATWTAPDTLLAWRNDVDGRAYLAWLGPDGGVWQGPGSSGVAVRAPARLSLARISVGAAMAFVNTNGNGQYTTIGRGQTSTSSTTGIGTSTSELVLEPAGSFLVHSVSSMSLVPHVVYSTSGFPQFPLEVLSEPFSATAPEHTATVVSGTNLRAGIAVQGASSVAFQSFALDAGVGLMATLPMEKSPALAANGPAAALATIGPGMELRVRYPSLEPSGLQVDAGYRFVGMAKATQRRPSVAWGGDRWIIVYEEETDAGFLGRYVTFDAGSVVGTPMPLPFTNPVLLTKPDGGLRFHGESFGQLRAGDATHVDGVLYPGSPTVFVGPFPAGSTTDLYDVFWSQAGLMSSAPGLGGPSSFETSYVPSRASAGTVGGLWIPFLTNAAGGAKAGAGFFSNTDLEVLSAPIAPLKPFGLYDLDPSVVPAIATKNVGGARQVLWAWATPTRDPVGFELGSQPSGAVKQGVVTSQRQARALAVAPTGAGWLLVILDDEGLFLVRVADDGTQLDTARLELDRWAGEPVAAASPSGEVAVVWPHFDPVSLAVSLRAKLVGPFAWPTTAMDAGVVDGGAVDAGPDDAGAADAGVTRDAGPASDDAGSSVDGGSSADAGAGGPLEFDTTGCACTTSPGNAGAWLLLALSLLAARRAARR